MALTPQRRLELLERLARVIAHDLNTQLTAVLGLAELTAVDPELPDRLRDDLRQVAAAAQRAGALTARLQRHCRPQPSGPQVVDLDEVIAAGRPERERLAGPRLQLRDVPAPALTLVEVDPVELHWRLLDVVLRAHDALPDGGRLTFTTTHENGCARLAITGMPEPVVISVRLSSA